MPFATYHDFDNRSLTSQMYNENRQQLECFAIDN